MGEAAPTAAERLAEWACRLEPSAQDCELAARALRDTIAVLLAARADSIRPVLEPLNEVGEWAALAHVLDYDDLHMESTAHLSAVCVPAALSRGGGERAYLAGAGVMARLGTALGWPHYQAGWHATCTAGAPGAAAAAGVGLGLDARQLGVAIALSIASAGGVQRAFGTAAKSLQVAAAVEAGVRAAELAAAGAGAEVRAMDDWMRLVGGDPEAVEVSGPAVPGGLATKLYPCCYALQRPIAAVAALGPLDAERVRSVTVRTPAGTLTPLIHHRPNTGLEGKFSLEYGVAAALLDGDPGPESFTDAAVSRPDAKRLLEAVQVEAEPGGEQLLAGRVSVAVELGHGEAVTGELELPPGAPGRPLEPGELELKLGWCAPDEADELSELTWGRGAEWLRERLHPPLNRNRAE